MIFTFISLLLLCFLAVYAFMQRTEFGKTPSGKALEAIKRSPNFRDGQFQNLSPTPQLAEGANMPTVLYKFLFEKDKRTKPAGKIPSEKNDLKSLDPNENVLVWFGHSSYFIQAEGVKILVDPVFSGSASPIAGTTSSFAGSDVYSAADMPDIDILLLTHDHWDHLDYKTVVALKPKVGHVLTGLGTGAHLRNWGYDHGKISEKDWYETVDFGTIRFHVTPARHFSGRGFKRNGVLWVSFVLETQNRKLYLGGDSGYDAHFAEIGKRFGPFDLAILECGQYNADWPYIHMLPEQLIPAADGLGATAILPVHWAKFSLAPHAWDEPIKRFTKNAEALQKTVLTPLIGQKLHLDRPQQPGRWWESVT